MTRNRLTPPYAMSSPLAGAEQVRREASASLAVEGSSRDRRVYFEVFGCQMNKLDSELMLESLGRHGYDLTDDPDEAGVIVYNTCSVREHAEERVYSRLGSFQRRKARDPELVIALTGCIAQHHERALLERLPHVDLVVGTRQFDRLPALIEGVRSGSTKRVATELDSPLEFHRQRNLGPTPHQAFVSVMRGCDQVCAYCIVPTTRGREVSRAPDEILAEVARLARGGVKEVTLLGQTVNSYGKRLGDGIGLDTILRGVDEIPEMRRTRFITSHPRYMRPRLIETMAACESVCEYLHLPVQSGSSHLLARMKRTYDREFYLRVVERCRDRIPGFSIATDFIVGFPGETDEDHRQSLSLVREVGLDHGYVFKYSPRPGTVAHRQSDDVPDHVKKERHAELLSAILESAERANAQWVGRTVEVLSEGPSKSDPTRFTGRTRDHRIVHYAALEDEQPGCFVEVEIEGATGTSLRGRRLGRRAAAG